MNEVYLMGNLTKDVEIRYTKTNKMVCTYTVACSERFIAGDGTEKEVTAFVNCVSWNYDAEKVVHGKKGNRIMLNGRINTRSYEDSNNNKHYVTEVITKNVVLDTFKSNSTGDFESFGNDEQNIPF
ncbi:single-stranded DNA-binding protein [Veillonella sp.]|uniref:single-stranded DNA-binding protein n=1 Tax=Veillonella sp. TaxID=1926307 RepID=UPI0025E17792|nr:single-stranded DNA-binding protein [Veillonella sp.]